MQLSVSHAFLPKQRSTRASVVMDHFGIGFETGRHVIAEELDVPIRPGDVVCFTGASGSGKSSLMRAAATHLASGRASARRDNDGGCARELGGLTPSRSPVVDVGELVLPERILVEAIDLPVDESLPLLSSCGLGEAHLLLRTPRELSDGQRYRFRLALALSHKPDWIVADEFSATLDRTLAKVVAFNVRRIADRTGTGFLLATTHEDILADLSPDVHVQCRLDGEIACRVYRDEPFPALGEGLPTSPKPPTAGLPESVSAGRAGETCGPTSAGSGDPRTARAAGSGDPRTARKKKENSPLPATCTSPKRPSPTGRTSLGGITAATISASPAS